MHQNQEFQTRISDSSAQHITRHLLHLHPVVIRTPFPHNQEEEEKSDKRLEPSQGRQRGKPKESPKDAQPIGPKKGERTSLFRW
jgi:hypothetical protein